MDLDSLMDLQKLAVLALLEFLKRFKWAVRASDRILQLVISHCEKARAGFRRSFSAARGWKFSIPRGFQKGGCNAKGRI